MYCLSKLIIWLAHDAFLISLLFRIVSSLNHIHLHLFLINEVNVTLLKQFLCFFCLFKLIIRLIHDVCLTSLLFRIVSSLNLIHVTLLIQFLGLYCLSKLIIWLAHDAFFISLLFRIVTSLNQFNLPLFLINKVNITLLRQFLWLYFLFKLIKWLNHEVFLISLLFRIVSSLNNIHSPLFVINKVNVTLLRQFLGLYFLFKLIKWLNHNVFLI